MPDEYETFDYAETEFQSIEELKKRHDYDTHTFDMDKDKNRRKHVTDPKKTLAVAFEKSNKPEVRRTMERVAAHIVKEGRRIKSYDFASWMQRDLDAAVEGTGEKPECITSVLTPLIRIFGTEFPETRDFLPMGTSQYDRLIYNKDRSRYDWINRRLYGGGLSAQPLPKQS